jgi:aminoglycoside/choline kinase family phosphotransferase
VATPDDEAAGLRARIDSYLHESGRAPAVTSVIPLTADASDRRYFRVVTVDGRSIVLAVHAGPIDFATLPFANVAELLQQIPVPIPAVLGHSDTLGVIALEDLGDVTLQAHLGGASGSEQMALYREAVELIAILQRRGTELASDRYVPYTLAFDIDKLTWELDFFCTHFIAGYREITLTPSERGMLSDEWRLLATELAGEARVLCHRDYHSRNLMRHDGSLYIIDFQDARMGPDTYDLVSLLRDSYVDLTEAQVDELIGVFLAATAGGRRGQPRAHERHGGQDAVAGEFRRRFDLMALQRNLKALGTFGFQTTSRRNPAFIQYMPRTLEYVRGNLAKYPRFDHLRRLLAARIEELG